MEVAALVTGYVTEFLPQITILLIIVTLRELRNFHNQVSDNTDLANKNREDLNQLAGVVADIHDLRSLP